MGQHFSICPLKVNNYQLKTVYSDFHSGPSWPLLTWSCLPFYYIFQLGVKLYFECLLNLGSLDVKIKVCLERDSCQPRLELTQFSEMGRMEVKTFCLNWRLHYAHNKIKSLLVNHDGEITNPLPPHITLHRLCLVFVYPKQEASGQHNSSYVHLDEILALFSISWGCILGDDNIPASTCNLALWLNSPWGWLNESETCRRFYCNW